ncbi:MAG: thiamine phosphate synthase [Candidatus Poribacteria bacterium]|nr:thiamine phosphate synthase [Candidatus Poribacteria bacterium]
MTDKKHRKIDFKLYVITNRLLCEPRPLYDVIHDLLDAGVTAIQLREKDLGDLEFHQLAEQIAELCQTYSARLFINSRVEVALDLGVSGVHFPASTPSIGRIKAGRGKSLLIGCSIHSLGEAQLREKDGADFVTYSPIFPTASKPGYGPTVGLKKLEVLTSVIRIPVFALGGISSDRVPECIEAGAHGVAVMSGVMLPETATTQAREYIQALAKYKV